MAKHRSKHKLTPEEAVAVLREHGVEPLKGGDTKTRREITQEIEMCPTFPMPAKRVLAPFVQPRK